MFLEALWNAENTGDVRYNLAVFLVHMVVWAVTNT